MAGPRNFTTLQDIRQETPVKEKEQKPAAAPPSSHTAIASKLNEKPTGTKIEGTTFGDDAEVDHGAWGPTATATITESSFEKTSVLKQHAIGNSEAIIHKVTAGTGAKIKSTADSRMPPPEWGTAHQTPTETTERKQPSSRP